MASVITHAAKRFLATQVRVQGPSAVSGGHEGDDFSVISNLLIIT